MTDQEHSSGFETTEHRMATNTLTQDPGNLLVSDAPVPPANVNVYVYTFPGSGSPVAGFALSPHATKFYTGGLEWKFALGSDYSLFITFMPLPGTIIYASKVECTAFSYSAPRNGMQGLAIPPKATTEPFLVYFTNGTKHDPQIVVTPIGSTGDG